MAADQRISVRKAHLHVAPRPVAAPSQAAQSVLLEGGAEFIGDALRHAADLIAFYERIERLPLHASRFKCAAYVGVDARKVRVRLDRLLEHGKGFVERAIAASNIARSAPMLGERGSSS